MQKWHIFSLLLYVALLAAPALAQDTAAIPMATFGDETGLFSVQYPAELYVVGTGIAERSRIPVPNVLLVSSYTLLTRVITSEAPPWTTVEMGDWGVVILFFPKATFGQMGVAADAPILDVANAWVQIALSDPGSATFQPDLVILDSGAEAIVITSRGDDGAGGSAVEDQYMMLHEITDGVIALTTIVSAVDGRTDAMIAAHLAMTNSLEFTGTAEDVLAAMHTGQ